MEVINDTGAHTFYLPYQILASSLLALAGFLIGLLLAWIILGRYRSRVTQQEKRNAELRALRDA